MYKFCFPLSSEFSRFFILPLISFWIYLWVWYVTKVFFIIQCENYICLKKNIGLPGIKVDFLLTLHKNIQFRLLIYLNTRKIEF